jgi:Sec-independent protein secretion pathway component TatC
VAGVTGLALRTIQRIEATGSASYESVGAIAAVFELPVTALREGEGEPAARTPGAVRWFTWHRLVTLLGFCLLAAIFTPPNFRQTIPVALAFWLSCELAIKTRRSRLTMNR